MLSLSLGLPYDIVREILDDAEYWIRVMVTGGNIVVKEQGAVCVAKAQVPPSARLHKPVRRIAFVADATERGGSYRERRADRAR